MTYRHAGDAGDLLSFLPVMRHLGRGILYIEAANYTRTRMSPDNWRGLDRILKAQPYVEDVREWRGERVHINGNDFRAHLQNALRRGQGKDRLLTDWALETHGVPLAAKDEPWLTIPPKRVARVVFNRTGPGRPPHHIYHNSRFPWHKVWSRYKNDAVFVGLPEEYEVFCATCGEVPHERTADLCEAAQVISGCDLFVGNQSAPFWLAAGMFKPIVLEVWLQGANSCLNRPNVVNGLDEKTELPDL